MENSSRNTISRILKLVVRIIWNIDEIVLFVNSQVIFLGKMEVVQQKLRLMGEEIFHFFASN